MSALHRISKKRFANEKKLLTNPEKALHYATAFPSEKPGEELVWYFLIMGDDDSDYKGGEYIGKIIHNKDYPAKAPDYMMLTPNGRYLHNSKICLSNSSYHAGEWTSSWNIITILIAFSSIWYDDKESGIAHIKDSPQNRRRMACESIQYNMKNYSDIYDSFNREFLSGSMPKKIPIKEITSAPAEPVIEKTEKEKKEEENNELLNEINNIFFNDDETNKVNEPIIEENEESKFEKKKVKKTKKKTTVVENYNNDNDDDIKVEKKKTKKKTKKCT